MVSIVKSGLAAPEGQLLPGPVKLPSKASTVYQRALDDAYLADRGIDGGVLPKSAEIHVEPLAADHRAIVAENLLSEDQNAECMTRLVDDAVPAGERHALTGHRIDQQRNLCRVFRMFV